MTSTEDLKVMDRPALLAVWKTIFESDPPKGISQPFLRHFLAFEIQLQSSGRLPKEVARLRKTTGAPSAAKRQPQTGTRFVREWQGRTHVVEKTDTGFRWNGQTYRSLSAIARMITGVRWPGPRFFGLAQREQR